MEDPSSWESWTTPLPAGPVMDYPTGYQLPSPPRPGYIGDIRVLPQATPDAIRFAERLWPQRSADGFEQRAKRWVERTTGNEYARVRGNPLMGDDARVADLFLVVEDSLIFLPRTEEQATSRPLGSIGGWRGR